MKENLVQTLSQQLQQRLSPLQMRLVRMLEMSAPEMEEEVRRELDDNPALESEDESVAPVDDNVPYYRLGVNNRSADDTTYEPVAVDEEESMIDILMDQLAETDMPESDKPIAAYIIGNLDSNGYMTRTLPQIADDLAVNAGIEIAPEHLRSVFERVRALDPAGIGAMDLRDCLLLQLKRLSPTPSRRLAHEIVNHYFDLFSLRHFDKLRSLLGVDREALLEAEDVIRSLDPKPASRMAVTPDDKLRYIVPDFYVEVADDGTLTVTMPNNIPELTIEKSFKPDEPSSTQGAKSDAQSRRREALAFITRKREEATDFIDLLRLRRDTLMRVMEAIASIQHDFFMTEDEASLRPMVLKDIAARTGFDISVISRATQGKYVATQSGTYPLKFFFNERVRTNDNDEESVSSRAIMAAIKELVSLEDHKSPMSDEALLAALKDKGFKIARRTVAKYRDRLGIPVARLRKQL
ncbi:MAG: RNA polymerase factor sigma-54 [Muribaculaceae bacterium]|nr:RNA polymerase factor sigma-54 [Muribaculaceae bacterium]